MLKQHMLFMLFTFSEVFSLRKHEANVLAPINQYITIFFHNNNNNYYNNNYYYTDT